MGELPKPKELLQNISYNSTIPAGSVAAHSSRRPLVTIRGGGAGRDSNSDQLSLATTFRMARESLIATQ
nr:hypothetical protein BaRGS_016484 [Batillaria attramentaria]